MKKIKWLLALSLLCAGNCLYAQKDYVVLSDNTKLMGTIKNASLSKVKFTASGEKKAKSYKPADVKEIYWDGHAAYRCIDLPGDKGEYFLQVLEDGKIKLYEFFQGGTYGSAAPNPNGGGFGFGGGGTPPKQTWYAQKDNGELVEVKSNGIWGSRKKRKDNFTALIEDKPSFLERFVKEDDFSFDFVRALIKEYNSSVK